MLRYGILLYSLYYRLASPRGLTDGMPGSMRVLKELREQLEVSVDTALERFETRFKARKIF